MQSFNCFKSPWKVETFVRPLFCIMRGFARDSNFVKIEITKESLRNMNNFPFEGPVLFPQQGKRKHGKKTAISKGGEPRTEAIYSLILEKSVFHLPTAPCQPSIRLIIIKLRIRQGGAVTRKEQTIPQIRSDECLWTIRCCEELPGEGGTSEWNGMGGGGRSFFPLRRGDSRYYRETN